MSSNDQYQTLLTGPRDPVGAMLKAYENQDEIRPVSSDAADAPPCPQADPAGPKYRPQQPLPQITLNVQLWKPEVVSALTHAPNQPPSLIPKRSLPGVLVPQERYTAIQRHSTQGRVQFNLAGSEHLGVPLTDILNNTSSFARLLDAESPFPNTGTKSFTLRILWPGRDEWSKTLSPLDWTTKRAPKTRAKIAKEIAKAITKFLEELRVPGGQWALIRPRDLSLISLDHVSKNSWQPEICLLTVPT